MAEATSFRSLPLFGLRAAVSVALMAATALLARAPIGTAATDSALRVALSSAHGRIEICRTPSEQELVALPVHMRAQRLCAETAPDYRLQIEIDGLPRLDRRIVPQGVRRTRPLAVDATLRLPPGTHRVGIRFGPAPLALVLDEATREAFERLPAATFDQQLDFAAGRILLVTLGENGQLHPVVTPPAS